MACLLGDRGGAERSARSAWEVSRRGGQKDLPRFGRDWYGSSSAGSMWGVGPVKLFARITAGARPVWAAGGPFAPVDSSVGLGSSGVARSFLRSTVESSRRIPIFTFERSLAIDRECSLARRSTASFGAPVQTTRGKASARSAQARRTDILCASTRFQTILWQRWRLTLDTRRCERLLANARACAGAPLACPHAAVPVNPDVDLFGPLKADAGQH